MIGNELNFGVYSEFNKYLLSTHMSQGTVLGYGGTHMILR